MLRPLFIVASPLIVLAAISCGDSGGSDVNGNGASGSGNLAGDPGVTVGGDPSASGGNTSTGDTSTGGARAGTAGSAANGGGTTSAGGTQGTAGTGGSTTPGAGGAAAGAGGASAAQCPAVFGTYKVQNGAGMCGTLNKAAPQSIEGDDVTCAAHFVSTAPKGKQAAVNGTAMLDANGNFIDAKLDLGDTPRQPCTGTWNDKAQTMTVKCGGAGDLCTVILSHQ